MLACTYASENVLGPSDGVMGKGGQRALQEEKVLLSELGKLFHIARANAREQRIKSSVRAARHTTTDVGSTKKTKEKSKKKQQRQEQDPKRKRSRRRQPKKNARGGTVWVVLKGGFAQVPTADNAAVIARNSKFRGRLSERRRVEALEAAEQYVQTAWQQAREADLLLEDGSGPSSEEGLQYLREQYEVAATMLRREPIGMHLNAIVGQTIPSSVATATAAATAEAASSATPLYNRDQWADFIARENVILNRFASPSASTDGGDHLLREAEQVASQFYFATSEPLAPHDTESPKDTTVAPDNSGNALRGELSRDVLPTKCIVRIRSSGRHKHTSILSTIKAVNYFKSNFMQVVRKELGSSKLPRGEDLTESKQQQQQQRHGTGSTAPDIATSGSSKKRRGKRNR